MEKMAMKQKVEEPKSNVPAWLNNPVVEEKKEVK